MSTSDELTFLGFVITLGVAIVGWVWLRRADARTVQALRLAQSAEDRAQRLEDQAIESRDVRWDTPRDEEGPRLTLRNAGTDPAHEVVISIDFPEDDLARKLVEINRVGPDEFAPVNLEHEARVVKGDGTQDPYSGEIEFPMLILDVTVRWTSPQGVPGVQKMDLLYR